MDPVILNFVHGVKSLAIYQPIADPVQVEATTFVDSHAGQKQQF